MSSTGTCFFYSVTLLLAFAAADTSVHAQDVTRLYSAEELRTAGRVYARNIQGMWKEDFIERLEPAERHRARGISLFLPRVGPRQHPLEYFADPDTRQVFIPIASVKFLDDLSIAMAYFERHDCDLGKVLDYAAMLRLKQDGFAEPPLVALGIPDDALEDDFVDDVAQKLLKSTLFFLAAHEYAHVVYQHRPYSALSADDAQAQEVEADSFALDVLRRIAVAPLALGQFFMIAARLEPTRQEFASAAEYEAYFSDSTHPVSARRLESVAVNVAQNLDAYADAQSDPAAYRRALGDTVADLQRLAEGLRDSALLDYLASGAADTSPSTLAASCRAAGR